MACQILDMSQSINESINQSTQRPKHESINQWTLESEAIYCFLEWPGANYGGRLGGRPRPTARNRSLFLYSFSSIFDRFGQPSCSQNPEKSIKNVLQNRTWFSYRFRYHFSSIFLRFSLPADTENQAKTMECCHFLYFFWFSSRLPRGIDFGWFWHRFWKAFGINFRTFSGKRRVQKIIKISYWFLCIFYWFSAPSWPSAGASQAILETLLWLCLPLGFVLKPFLSILGGFGAEFSHFSVNFSIIFVWLLGFVSYSSSVYVCTASCTLFVWRRSQ